MMKLHHLMENFPLARLALAAFPHDAASLEQTLPHFRISANAVYPFRTNGQLCFLRLAPTDEKEFSQIAAEVEYILYLRRRGFPAMEPVPARSGEYVLSLETPFGPYTATAFFGVPGTPAEDVPCTREMLLHMGRTLGQMHLLGKDFSPSAPRADHETILQSIRRILIRTHAPSGLLSCWQRIQRAMAALPVTPDTYGLVHFDFEPDNVFWNAESKTCSVIDFDDAMYGFFSMDVEKSLDALSEITDEDGCAAFLEGYRQVLPFTADMEAQRPLMRVFIRLYTYARLCHCLQDNVQPMPEWMPPLVEKLTRKKAALEAALMAAPDNFST